MAARIVLAIVGLIALAAAVTVSLAAAGVALFLALRDLVGPAWSALIVAGVFAVLVALVVVIAGTAARKTIPKPPPVRELKDRVMDLVREKPVTTAGVAAAIGLLAVLRPQLITAVARAFIETRPPQRGRRR